MSENKLPDALNRVLDLAMTVDSVRGFQSAAFGPGVSYVTVPESARVYRLDDALGLPPEMVQSVRLATQESFVSYVLRFGDGDSIVAFDRQQGRFHAVLDYVAKAGARRCKHKVEYRPVLAQQWLDWTSRDGKLMPQDEFAQFIADHLPDITDPPSAQMLEIAQSLRATRTQQIKSGFRTDNGDIELAYSRTTTAATGGRDGSLVIPSEFTIAIPIMQGGDAWKIPAQFQWRVTDDTPLQMGFRMRLADRVRDRAFDEMVEQIRAAVSTAQVELYHGEIL